MKQLKLEVGKTYRSRKGEEVRIVRKADVNKYVYQGSNGEWYTESGRWEDFGVEDPLDLIEEIPSDTRHTFKIPDGVKKVTVLQEGSRIIVEMVPEAKEPKPGDVRFKEGDIVFEDGRIMIVKKYPNLYHAMIHGNPDYLRINGSYGIPFTSATFRPATPEEAQPLFDALEKAGKRWNPETMEVEEITEKEQIEKFLEGYANNVKWNPETMEVEEITEKEQIEKFLEGYANNVKWSHEQLRWLIEAYLKHKEGDK